MRRTEVLIHYIGWGSKWDEWMPSDSPRIAPLNTHALSGAAAGVTAGAGAAGGAAGGGGEWEWHDGGAGWKEYSQDVCRQLNEAVASGKATAVVASDHRNYSVDFTRMQQTNAATGFARPIRKKRSTTTTAAAAAGSSTTTRRGQRQHPSSTTRGRRQPPPPRPPFSSSPAYSPTSPAYAPTSPAYAPLSGAGAAGGS